MILSILNNFWKKYFLADKNGLKNPVIFHVQNLIE